MNFHSKLILNSVLSFVLFMVSMPETLAQTGDPVLLNEVYASHTGTDDTEYVELYGIPGTSLEGISLLVVESDVGASNGNIDRRMDFTADDVIGSNGFYLIGNPVGLASYYNVTPNIEIAANYLENSSLTVALVETVSISGGVVSGSEIVLDSVALNDGDESDMFFFGAPVVGPDGPFFPAGARRIADGVDTDTAADWLISGFNLGPDNTPMGGDTPPPPPPTPMSIMQIQGSGQYSPYIDERIETTGVVTLYTANGANFWLQDPDGDGDATTSDGVFVAGGGFPASGSKPVVGDYVRVVAKVQEQQFGYALPLTRLISVEEIEVLSNNHLMPRAVELSVLPSESIEEGAVFWEPLEGMLVQVEDAIVVSPTSGFGEFAMITKANSKLRSGFYKSNSHLLIRSIGDQQVDYNPERILVDDGSLDSAVITKPGDEMKSLLGVVDYTFGNYKLQPVSFFIEKEEDYDYENEHRFAKRDHHNKWHGNYRNRLTVATFNVENLFDLIDDPIKDDESSTPTAEELEIKLGKLTLAIADEMHLPDVIVIQEVENTAILQQLADRINSLTMSNYHVASFESSDERGIEVGFMWDTNRVTNSDVYQMTGADVEAAFGPESASPGREPLVGVFSFNEAEFILIGNHFKSKGGDDPLFGINQPPVRITEEQRKLQAQTVRNFVNQLFVANPKANVIVAGDLNDFQFAEPGEGDDHPIAIIEGLAEEVALTNLIREVKESERFTYIYDGNSQALDHMLVSPSLLEQVKTVRIPRFNANYPEILGADPTSANRSSDHDPIVATFKLKD
ncbi:MAG: hypothetical protein AMJ55_07500 [Gammaproteobacteria bacterium SG8_15]|nr:MAG: hypothetical protein AMJ55_07500 [Gammaproteobacteria bacterium SG8_15]